MVNKTPAATGAKIPVLCACTALVSANNVSKVNRKYAQSTNSCRSSARCPSDSNVEYFGSHAVYGVNNETRTQLDNQLANRPKTQERSTYIVQHTSLFRRGLSSWN